MSTLRQVWDVLTQSLCGEGERPVGEGINRKAHGTCGSVPGTSVSSPAQALKGTARGEGRQPPHTVSPVSAQRGPRSLAAVPANAPASEHRGDASPTPSAQLWQAVGLPPGLTEYLGSNRMGLTSPMCLLCPRITCHCSHLQDDAVSRALQRVGGRAGV